MGFEPTTLGLGSRTVSGKSRSQLAFRCRNSKLTALDLYAQIMHIKAYADHTEY